MSTYADLANAAQGAATLFVCDPVSIPFSQPLIISKRSGFTLDLTGVSIYATGDIVDPQLLAPSLIYLDQCTDVHILRGEVSGNGYQTQAVGMHACTDCSVEHVVASACNSGFGQFWSLASTRGSWLYNRSTGGVGTTRGFWLGNVGGGLETDLTVIGNQALGMPATGIAVMANGAKIGLNTCNDNQGAGIASASANDASSAFHTVFGNICRRNAFWGWQSDVYAPATFIGATVTGNVWDSNKAGAALLNLCQNITYQGNEDDGIVQVIGCTNGRVLVGRGGTLSTIGAANTGVLFA